MHTSLNTLLDYKHGNLVYGGIENKYEYGNEKKQKHKRKWAKRQSQLVGFVEHVGRHVK